MSVKSENIFKSFTSSCTGENYSSPPKSSHVRTMACSRNSPRKTSGRILPHNNRWLLYSSTVILLSFIFLLDLGTVRVVDCVASNEDSNDIGSRHVDKIPGKSVKPVGSSIHHNHDSNEVSDFKSFPFPSADSENEDDEDSYEDTSYYDQFGSSDEMKPAEVQYIDQYENEHHLQGKPQIAKCCPYGEAINADGKCKQFRSLEARHNQK